MSQDQHTTEQGPGKPLSGSVSASDPGVGASRRSDPENGAQAGAEGFGRFDRDPEALAWARAKAQGYIDQLAAWARQADERGAEVKAHSISICRLLAERRLIGGRGCTIGAFDERLPAYRAALDDQPPAPDAGPTVREAADHDRRWWNGEKAGE